MIADAPEMVAAMKQMDVQVDRDVAAGARARAQQPLAQWGQLARANSGKGGALSSLLQHRARKLTKGVLPDPSSGRSRYVLGRVAPALARPLKAQAVLSLHQSLGGTFFE